MDKQYEFNDVLIADNRGNVEYVRMGDYDFFQVDKGDLVGTKVTQWYQNRDETSSTIMQAAYNGIESLNYVDYLTTEKGRVVRQYSDTLCIKDNEEVIGAVEFAWYDPEKDIIFEPKSSSTEENIELGISDYVGTSPSINSIKHKISKVADITTPIFITGSTGTGKETLARIIHQIGNRKGDFVYVNCGALPENLLESILFGTAKGSFTGSTDKDGLFQAADNGTLFLDELSNMPLPIQGKILKAIEEKRIRRVGDDQYRSVDVRIISSCNESVNEIIADRLLRSDLFFRISSIQFELPDLKDRREDILPLCEYYIDKFGKKYSKPSMHLSAGSKAKLTKYTWPGNVRELRNKIENAVYRTEGNEISLEEFQALLQTHPAQTLDVLSEKLWKDYQKFDGSLKEYMETVETSAIQKALINSGGSIPQAARHLGISQQSLRQKLKKQKKSGHHDKIVDT